MRVKNCKIKLHVSALQIRSMFLTFFKKYSIFTKITPLPHGPAQNIGSHYFYLSIDARMADQSGLVMEKLDKVPDALTRVSQSGANNIQIIQKKKERYFVGNCTTTVWRTIE